ncbi:MAG: substrate-binding domain-containing protein [Desulfuromonadaceae bacterium]|nr:substrate-binding domain-containing protein [Desulfuromonadaceae bacterium]
MRIASVFFFTVVSTFLLVSCSEQPEQTAQKELLIYCGTTMAGAVRSVADEFEKKEDCVIKILSEGSGNLLLSIRINRVGDLFLPGSEQYVEACRQEGLVDQTKIIGYNRAVLLVAKGNPLNLTPDLTQFVSGRYRTVLGIAESSSIGKETREILTQQGLYDVAINHATFLATDSKDILELLRSGKADLALNWTASALTSPENREAVDLIALPKPLRHSHPLIMAVLTTARQPELADKFLDWITCDVGRSILASYGFGD